MAGEVDFSKDITVDANGTNFTTGDATSSDQIKKNEANEDRKLFVGGLSWETRENHLKDYFEKFGEVEKVDLKLNPMTGKSRCFAFIIYADPSSIHKVLDAGDHAINSKKVDVKKAKGRTGKIFVGGLKAEMTDQEIRAAFEKFGTIVEFEMPMDKVKKTRKGFGFITFEREEVMKELVKKGKVSVGGHEVDLRKAAPRQDQGTWYGGQGGGYGWPGDFYGSYYGGYDYYGAGGGWGYPYGGAYGQQRGGGGKMRGGRRGAGGGGPY